MEESVAAFTGHAMSIQHRVSSMAESVEAMPVAEPKATNYQKVRVGF